MNPQLKSIAEEIVTKVTCDYGYTVDGFERVVEVFDEEGVAPFERELQDLINDDLWHENIDHQKDIDADKRAWNEYIH